MWVSIQTCISLLCQQRGLGVMIPKQQQVHLDSRCWFLVPRPNKRNQDSLENWLILQLGQGLYKVNLGHLVGTENKEMLRHAHTQSLYQRNRRAS